VAARDANFPPNSTWNLDSEARIAQTLGAVLPRCLAEREEMRAGLQTRNKQPRLVTGVDDILEKVAEFAQQLACWVPGAGPGVSGHSETEDCDEGSDGSSDEQT